MNELIKVVDGEILADSRMIAEHFRKEHSHVMRDIKDELEKLGEIGASIFGLSSYVSEQNKTLPCYSMGEDGLMQLAARYDAIARRKLIIMIKELKQTQAKKLPSSYKEALLQLVKEIEEKEALQLEVAYKEDVIIGLVEDIDIATKRQRLNQIMTKNFKDGSKQSDKWSLLYKEFEAKYHLNLNTRMTRDFNDKPKYKSKIDYIDRKMNMIPQIYELACKIFENDVEKLKSEWFDTVRK